MMTSTGSNVDHPVAQRLSEAGITEAVVIDDAYDSPVYADLRNEVSEFWAEIIRNEDALAELSNSKTNVTSEDDIDEELVNSLWLKTIHGELNDLSGACNTLFARRLERLDELNALNDYLQRVGVRPILLGCEDALPSEQVQLFFLDFFLGPDPIPFGSGEFEEVIRKWSAGELVEPSIEASMAKAEEIRKNFTDPFIVLMSSKPTAELARSKFREKTGLLEGMFGYVAKEYLEIEKELYLRLGTWAIGMPARHDIQHFVEALEASVTESSKEFITRIKSLSFEDYLYVQSPGLQKDGHPLGDYMLWMYKSLLAYLLHSDPRVIEQQKILDALDVDRYVPLKAPPSLELAQIYTRALTEPGVDEVPVRSAASHGDGHPYVRLGDLFVRDKSSDVLLVINADCDLAYAPQNSKRPFPGNLSILLEPGRFQPVDQRIDAKWKVTHLFEFEDEVLKIEWDHERVFSKPYWGVWNWLRSQGYLRKARLTTHHALEIQQHFAAKLTRVGMPVEVPLPQRATIEVFVKGDDGTAVQVGHVISNGVAVDKEGFRFTVEGVCALIDILGECVDHYLGQRDSCDKDSKRYKRLSTNIEKLQAFNIDYGEWFEILTPKPLPNQGGIPLGSVGVVKVYCNSNLEKYDSFIVVNLRFEESSTGLDDHG